MYRYFAYINVRVQHMGSAGGSQKQTSDPLKLELERVASYPVGAGD